MRTKVVLSLVAGLLLGMATVDNAFAQISPAQTEDPTWASPHTRRLYECRELARQHNFGFRFIRKGRFMRACMKLPKR
jgi:hypothetical protein